MNVPLLELVFLIVVLVELIGIVVCLIAALYLAYTKLDTMLESLSNCPAVMTRAALKNGGPVGKLFVLGGVMGVVARPSIYLRDGGASPTDLANFPAPLKRQLVVLQLTSWGLVASMVLIWGFSKLID